MFCGLNDMLMILNCPQERTIEHERTTSAAVKQLRNDLKDEKTDHEDKVRVFYDGFTALGQASSLP